MLKEALNRDPDCNEAKIAIKMVKVTKANKEEAGALFKADKLDEAIEKFDECLQLDPLNLNYNATILLNKSIALVKQEKKELALASLNKCLRMNPKYAKALVKRGEVYSALGDWEEAVNDYGAAAQIDSSGFNVQQKLKHAQGKAK